MTINRQTLLDAARDMLREYENAHGRGEELPYPIAAACIIRDREGVHIVHEVAMVTSESAVRGKLCLAGTINAPTLPDRNES